VPEFNVPLMIGDRDAAASGGGVFERRDPVRGDVVSLAASATLQDARDAANAAAAFPAWPALRPSERRALLNCAADRLLACAPRPRPRCWPRW
jgi:acyl-CoA reductase-like NAD-dependent aldehyde dehydrogenase